MKPAIVLFFLSLNAHAGTVALFCGSVETPGSCAVIAEYALQAVGCVIDSSKTTCTYSLIEDPKNPGSTIRGDKPYCDLSSENCSRPQLGNFGGESCAAGEIVNIPSGYYVDNGYWLRWWRSNSRAVCIIR